MVQKLKKSKIDERGPEIRVLIVMLNLIMFLIQKSRRLQIEIEMLIIILLIQNLIIRLLNLKKQAILIIIDEVR